MRTADDLVEIDDILRRANVRLWETAFVDDGATEFVLEDRPNFELAVTALREAGWPDQEAFERVARDYSNESPERKYRLAQTDTLIRALRKKQAVKRGETR